MAAEAGAVATGVALTDENGFADSFCSSNFKRWLQEGNNADMQWLERHAALRCAPSLLLDGAEATPRKVSVISTAFSYRQPVRRPAGLPEIARFAYGEDYHKVLKRKLKPVCKYIESATGAKTRICIDSAPLYERYWAMKAGIGRQGLSGMLIVPGYGTYVLLAEIVTDLELEADTPQTPGCLGCRRCIERCPTGAIKGDLSIDASKCRAYLSIECKQPTTGNLPLFGCDICQVVCPHNRDAKSDRCLDEFLPSREMLSLSETELRKMTDDEFLQLFGNTPLKRAGLEKLKRNIFGNENE